MCVLRGKYPRSQRGALFSLFSVAGLLISLAVLLQQSAALYLPSADVIELTLSNFDKEVLRSDSIWIVEFYAPWCGHCQRLAPEYELAAKDLKGVVKVGAVNVDKNMQLGRQYRIQRVPTIKIFGTSKYAPTDFNGPKTAQGIIEAGRQEIAFLKYKKDFNMRNFTDNVINESK